MKAFCLLSLEQTHKVREFSGLLQRLLIRRILSSVEKTFRIFVKDKNAGLVFRLGLIAIPYLVNCSTETDDLILLDDYSVCSEVLGSENEQFLSSDGEDSPARYSNKIREQVHLYFNPILTLELSQTNHYRFFTSSPLN